MRLSVIAAMDRASLIGDDRGMPWEVPTDLRRFRELTMGKPVIVGRKTIELIGRPLPGRHNIVLTHREDYAGPGCRVVHSVPDALAAAQDYLAKVGGDEAMVIGGGLVFEEMTRLCNYAYLTMIDGVFGERLVGKAWFPVEALLANAWSARSSTRYFPAGGRDLQGHWYVEAERIDGLPPRSGDFDIIDWMLRPEGTAAGVA